MLALARAHGAPTAKWQDVPARPGGRADMCESARPIAAAVPAVIDLGNLSAAKRDLPVFALRSQKPVFGAATQDALGA